MLAPGGQFQAPPQPPATNAVWSWDGLRWNGSTLAAIGALLAANNLSDLVNAATARTNLGLGSIATQAASAVAITGGNIDGTAIGSTTRGTISGTTGDFNSTLNVSSTFTANSCITTTGIGDFLIRQDCNIGGTGIGGQAATYGHLYVYNSSNVQQIHLSGFDGSATIAGITTLTGALVANSATASTSPSTGGAIFAGGVGVTSQLNAQSVSTQCNTASAWTGTAYSGGNSPIASITTASPFFRSVSLTAGGYDAGIAMFQSTTTGVNKPSAVIGVLGASSWTNGTVSTQTSELYFLLRDNTDMMVERLRCKASGRWLFAAAVADNTLQVNGASGQYTAYFVGNASSGNSFGPFIQAGSTSGDECVRFYDSSGTNAYFKIRGDGALTVPTGSLTLSGVGKNIQVEATAGFTIGSGGASGYFQSGIAAGPTSGGMNVRCGNGSSALTLSGNNGGTHQVINNDGNIALFGAGSWGSGTLCLFIANRSAAPSANPTGGGILYAEAGALKWRGSSGTVTTIAAA